MANEDPGAVPTSSSKSAIRNLATTDPERRPLGRIRTAARLEDEGIPQLEGITILGSPDYL